MMKTDLPKGYSPNMGRRAPMGPPAGLGGPPPMMGPPPKMAPPKRTTKAPKAPARGGGGFKPPGGGMRGC